jgi:flavin reductase (DIM6/NTAB) family NADH-FMN oxidoreductase RutF
VVLAQRFSQPHEDRFAGVDYRLGESDAPLIAGCVAWLECRQYARREVGDHILFIGEVLRCQRGAGLGLLFVHGGFAMPAPLPPRVE